MRDRSVRDVCAGRSRVPMSESRIEAGAEPVEWPGVCLVPLKPPGERLPDQWFAPVCGSCVPMHREPRSKLYRFPILPGIGTF